MRMTGAMVAVVCLVFAGWAQELVPELAAASGKHKAAVEALELLRLESVAQAARSYVTALDGIEKSATAKGEIDLVAAVVKEREAAVAGALEPDLSAALPKAKLQGTRKALLAKDAQVNVDFARRRKLADGDYLKALATLQAKAAPDSDLAKQVAAEKAALLAGADAAQGGGTEKAGKVSRGKNVVVNGDFEKVGADGKPDGWTLENASTVITERDNRFFRFDQKPSNKDGTADYATIWQEIDIPGGVKSLTVSLRMRTESCKSASKAGDVPRVSACFRNSEGKLFKFIIVRWPNVNGKWCELSESGPLPIGAVKVKVEVTNGHSPGPVDFDGIEVTFK